MNTELSEVGPPGEEMTEVADNSVDVVVVTLVFCSVGDADKILQQILRVLAPVSVFSHLKLIYCHFSAE